MKTLLTAAFIAPMHRPMLRDAAVVFDGETIAAIGPADRIKSQHPDAIELDLGNVVLLPGLVNAHAHLELSDLKPGHVAGNSPPAFVDWLITLMQQTGAGGTGDELTRLVSAAIFEGVRQCLQFGVTSVGDISFQCDLTRPLLKDSPLNVVSYGEVRAMAQRRHFLDEHIARAIDRQCETHHLHAAISPHAPYSVESNGYARCLAAAKALDLPLTTHLAETRDESEFLAHHAGPLRGLWEFLGAWDANVPHFEGGPIRFAQSIGLLDYPATLLAHVNYCDDAELDLLTAGVANVVYCPRTHAYFGHPPHRWREMLSRGINVAVGTDSCASSPDLNLVDDLRLMHLTAPEVDPATLWEMPTIRAARAIRSEDSVGSIAPGKNADVIAFEVRSDDPLREILGNDSRPNEVWIRGSRLK